MRPGPPDRASLAGLLALLAMTAGLLVGCSLIDPSARPVAGAQRNLYCTLEYRPAPGRPEVPEILFLAAGNPWQWEEFYMSPPDGLLHGIFAPGRHLVEPVRLRGVRCEPPLWGKGHRVPWRLNPDEGLLCRRRGLERVLIEVKTKWGECREEIPAGDGTPRCKIWYGRSSRDLERLPEEVCPLLPEPTRNSARGRMPSGGFWVTVSEGTGPRVGRGDRVRMHETVVSRSHRVTSSTQFGEARVVSLDEGEWPRWKVEGVLGMRLGEQRRLMPPLPPQPAGVTAEAPLFLYVEVVAILPPRPGDR